jgi:thioredoxin-dependent peroxiredoxin
MKRVQVGDRAPDFTLPANNGEQVSLSEFRGTPVVLYFYPRNETMICTAQACGFRDAYEDFTEEGAVVLGVSADSVGSHRRFAERHRLPFLLLADEDRSLRDAYGVPKKLGFLDGRVTYVIDKVGVVRHIVDARFSADQHVNEAREVLRKLAQEP